MDTLDVDNQRVSLLDVVQDKLDKDGKTSMVSRVVYVARLSERMATSNFADFKELFRRELQPLGSHDGAITGFMCTYSDCAVHVIEASTADLMSVLRAMAKELQRWRIRTLKVISLTEDIPARVFKNWDAAFASAMPVTDQAEPLEQSQEVQTASNLNLSLLELGKQLHGLGSEGEYQSALASLHSFYQPLPTPQTVLALTIAKEPPTLGEFLDVFDAPINVDLESERVWPKPVPLQY